MSSEVKQNLKSEYIAWAESKYSDQYCHVFYQEWLELELQSTRQALVDTKAQLEALEDAIEFIAEEECEGEFSVDSGYIISENAYHSQLRKLYQAIANSQARNRT